MILNHRTLWRCQRILQSHAAFFSFRSGGLATSDIWSLYVSRRTVPYCPLSCQFPWLYKNRVTPFAIQAARAAVVRLDTNKT